MKTFLFIFLAGYAVRCDDSKLKPRWILFPHTETGRQTVASGYQRKFGLPDILGTIDCTHIQLFPPPKPQQAQYRNRHGVTSINVQLIADAECKILNVNANFPGRVHDQFIYNGSVIKSELRRLHESRIGQYYLLGDSGYALEPWLMTPIRNAEHGTPEERYTKWHCQTRNVIERTNGYLKGTFRCLGIDRSLHYAPEKASALVYACCTLYNIMRHYRYYVVQMPVNDILPTKDFNVYWNVPSIQCKSRNILFDDLYENYGILQNTGDTFRGDKISILYDPGEFPALLTNSTSGEIKYRNGGVPQEGDLIRHLDTFQKVLEQSVPDKDFDGVGIIDFESWKPVLRQNFGILTPYKDVSYEIERKRHWWWKKQWIEEEAKRRFEEAGREFMQATVSLAKKMRPRALWGYYGFPYCFNMAPSNRQESCADNVPQENDSTSWLWQESTALYPSVYSSGDITSNQLAALIRGRVKEAARVATQGAPILPYFWYRYRDKGYFNESDLDVALSTFYKSNTSGFIIWGSSNDVNTLEKCQNLKKYVTDILGPAIAKYTKLNMRLGDESEETYNGVFKINNASKYDPEYTWIPPANYTQKIEEMVDKELKEEKEALLAHKVIKESILVDMILHKIANYCAKGCDNKSKLKRTNENEGDGGINESRVVLATENPFKKNSNGIGVTVPTTTEEDIYDYDTDTTGDVTAGDSYETNEYIVVSTTDKSNEQISKTIKRIEEVSTTATETDTISIVDISKEENDILNINKEKSSTVDVSNEESSTNDIGTTEADESRLIIEEIYAVDLSTEETNSTEESTSEISTTTSRPTESSIKEITTTESTTNYSSEGIITIRNDLSLGEDAELDKNNTESNSIEVDFIDVSTEESSTINPTTVNSTTDTVDTYSTVEPSTIDDDTIVSINSATVEQSAVDNSTSIGSESATYETNAVDNDTRVGAKIDSSTTLAPVLTEQVLGSVSRAIVSKPLACSLFYVYSIMKCLCVLFGNC